MVRDPESLVWSELKYNSLFFQSIIFYFMVESQATLHGGKHPLWELCMKFPMIKWNTQQSTQQWTQKDKSHKCHTVTRNQKCVTQTDIFFICSTPRGVSMLLCPQKKSQFDNFHSKKNLCVFLHIWRRFCNIIMQLKVDNILNFHYVMKLMHIWTMQWLISIFFNLQKLITKTIT
jgi:hypothetical protein